MAFHRPALMRFFQADGGNMAVLFGLSLFPIMAATSAALDYGGASNGRTIAQSEVDAAALEIMIAAVKIHTDPANASKTPAERNTYIETKAAAVLSARGTQVDTRVGNRLSNAIQLTGSWVDPLKTEYQVEASFDYKRYFPSFLGSSAVSRIAVSATAKMAVDTLLEAKVPKIDNPGFEAGDYNRIYAYCYNQANRLNPDKGRTQMTAVSSNGQDGSKSELVENIVFKNVIMPTCQSGETLSWRLYNVRDKRTTKSGWPTDIEVSGSTPKRWTQIDKNGVTIYNYYSDTQYNATSGAEEYAFNGAALGYNYPIAMMETVVCDTQDKCTPGRPGSITPSGKNRKPGQAPTACSPGKFMYIGWEDRPFLAKNPASNDYSSNNSFQWTDSDYDDIRLVVSCPEEKIVSYKTKVSLIR